MKLTQKQETFCLKYFELGNATEAALIAGYSPRTAQVIASENLTKPMIIERIESLRKDAEDASVATVLERKQILTEIARGNLLDYQEVGADGGYLSIGKESPNTKAISEITSRTEYDKDGVNATLITKVKLHNPVNAITELNKMEKIYSDNTTVINNNLSIDKAVINAGERLENAITRLSARIGETEVSGQPE